MGVRDWQIPKLGETMVCQIKIPTGSHGLMFPRLRYHRLPSEQSNMHMSWSQTIAVLVVAFLGCVPHAMVWGADLGVDEIDELLRAINQPGTPFEFPNVSPSFRVPPSRSGNADDTSSAEVPPVTPTGGDPHTRNALLDWRIPKRAPGYVPDTEASRFSFGPRGLGNSWTRVWNGESLAVMPLKWFRTELSLSPIPIVHADWSDLAMRTVIGSRSPTKDMVLYLVDGASLRSKYREHITADDYQHLGPGQVGVIFGVRKVINGRGYGTGTKYRYGYYLAAKVPVHALREEFWLWRPEPVRPEIPPQDVTGSRPQTEHG
ncbi:hypothetical protein BCV70DRAFT_67675 [Testicularia cyperi]|uniref:Uncharacterized protein n=1 Tax=Testicularia cyperi TaxID=1882483 RepID=A0A317XG91_9BASI|nr:hypothetical protein BCV70DRAFT_67675 [Testicularia cyperi]